MAKQKVTIPQLKEWKESGRKIRMVTAYDYPTALLVDRSEVELILVGDSLGMVVLGYDGTVPVTMDEMVHHIKPVVRGARNTLIVGDMPFMSYNVSMEKAIENAGRLMKEGGADCVKLEGGLPVVPVVRALVDAGIPVMAHIGLTPQTASQLGGFKVQGKDEAAAQRMLVEAQKLEEAGAFSIVLEAIPAPLAKLITAKIGIPTIGIGAGPACDGQILVLNDILGLSPGRAARFVKVYADLGKGMREAVSQYAAEVRTGRYPDAGHSYR